MPTQLTYPGVYIEEIPSGVRTITGVATSITAFIGRARKGPVNEPKTINNYGDFERIFGGIWKESMLGFAVRDFFLNGGSQAIIVRLFHPNDADLKAAQSAAQDVAKATKNVAPNATAAEAAQEALDEAKLDTNAKEPRKAVADFVAAAAKAASLGPNATAADVQDAAEKAAASAAPNSKATFTVRGLSLVATHEGSWGENLRVSVDNNVSEDVAKSMGLTKDKLFNITIKDAIPGGIAEMFRNLTLDDKPRRVDRVLKAESKLVCWNESVDINPAIIVGPPGDDPIIDAEKTLDLKKKDVVEKENALAEAEKAVPQVPNDIEKAKKDLEEAKKDQKGAKDALDKLIAERKSSDGSALNALDFIGDETFNLKQGLYALRKADLFNLLCIPPYSSDGKVETSLIDSAIAYCQDHRAMFLIDPPATWIDKDKALAGIESDVGSVSKNAAIFFPRLCQANPFNGNQVENFVPCGAVAGIFARTDTQRGVWKAPAGLEATLVGVLKLSVPLTDNENGELNPLGINCLRAMPAIGRVVWGSRTREGDDRLASEWKYIPVRRTALFIEESLYRGTKWIVFEPNDEPLWAQIRLNIGAFMHNLFRQGAFQGSTPREAYFVKCDKETTTQNDINLGIVNIVVGFAPLKPAEFVVIKLQQMAGQIET